MLNDLTVVPLVTEDTNGVTAPFVTELQSRSKSTDQKLIERYYNVLKRPISPNLGINLE